MHVEHADGFVRFVGLGQHVRFPARLLGIEQRAEQNAGRFQIIGASQPVTRPADHAAARHLRVLRASSVICVEMLASRCRQQMPTAELTHLRPVGGSVLCWSSD
jgi:hypothetical protein